jgi:hypothetical protein
LKFDLFTKRFGSSAGAVGSRFAVGSRGFSVRANKEVGIIGFPTHIGQCGTSRRNWKSLASSCYWMSEHRAERLREGALDVER